MTRGRTRIAILVGLLVLAATAYTVMESPAFRLQELVVAGGAEVSPEEVWSWSGLVPGEHLLSVRPAALAADLSLHPRLRSVAARVSVPGRLVVTVEEREGILLVAYHQGFLEVDADGWVIAWHDHAGARSLPVATGLSHGEVAVGERIPSSGAGLVVDLCGRLGPLSDRLSEINSSGGEITAYTVDGVAILWGDSLDGIDEKIDVLSAFLAGGDSGATYLDVRVPGRPVIGR